MKSLHGGCFVLVALWLTGPAGADDSAKCYPIRNTDLRAECLAETRNSSTPCYSIHDADRRQLCLARTMGTRARCYNIRDRDLRNLCLATSRKN